MFDSRASQVDAMHLARNAPFQPNSMTEFRDIRQQRMASIAVPFLADYVIIGLRLVLKDLLSTP